MHYCDRLKLVIILRKILKIPLVAVLLAKSPFWRARPEMDCPKTSIGTPPHVEVDACYDPASRKRSSYNRDPSTVPIHRHSSPDALSSLAVLILLNQSALVETTDQTSNALASIPKDQM